MSEEAGIERDCSEAPEPLGPTGPAFLTTLWKDLGEGSQSHCLWRNVGGTTTVPDQSRVGEMWGQMGPEVPGLHSVSQAEGSGALVN